METLLFEIVKIILGLMIADIWREVTKKEKPHK